MLLYGVYTHNIIILIYYHEYSCSPPVQLILGFLDNMQIVSFPTFYCNYVHMISI
jgi:hypothetical protein